MDFPRISAWTRALGGLIALAAMFTLAGCGGGSGSPNNPFASGPGTPTTLTVQPATVTLYPGYPAVLTVGGGTAPYYAFSSNSAVLPVSASVSGSQVVLLASDVSADTSVGITIRDSGSQSVAVTTVVRPAPLFSGLTIAASANDCGATNLCSGATGTASVAAKGAAGAPLPGRQVRFDVVYGPVALQTTNPVSPLASTLTVVTDAAGVARVGIEATVNSPTEPAQIRATDVTSGQQITGNFTVVNSTTTAAITVIPPEATITAAYSDGCTIGFQVNYYIYGGNPPYRVSSTFPAAVNIVNPLVSASGGYFAAVTNGTCVNPATFTIADSAGKQTTATLVNIPGTADRPTIPVADLAIQPTAITQSGCSQASKFQFVAIGGTAPYSVSTSSPSSRIAPQPVAKSGNTFTVEPYYSPVPSSFVGTTTVVLLDSSSPQKSVVATITCN
jgi:hypothetical protein